MFLFLSRSSVSFTFALVASLVFGSAVETSAAKPRGASEKQKGDLSDELFQGTALPRIRIEIGESAFAKLKQYQWKFGPQEERESVAVTVREGENVYTNVSLHLKGAAGSFQSVEQKPAMTLNFDRWVPGQRFHGLSKLSLNNSVQDPTFVSEQLCREIFLKAQVPVPRAAHALVELNGRDLGLYVLLEGWDKQFLKRHFKKVGGNLYDGGFIKEVTDTLATNAGDDPKNQNDRISLADAAKETNLTNRIAKLEKILDVERFITFVALDTILWNWDGYAQNRNNWRLYHDRDTDRMIFMPHGLDQMFWKPDGSVLPPMRGLVAESVLEVSLWRERYFQRMLELRASVFNPTELTNRANQISGKFSQVLREKDSLAANEQQNALQDFCHAIVRRAASLDRQLLGPVKPTDFDNTGSARLVKWSATSDFGDPELKQSDPQEQSHVLLLGTTKGSSIGSWRTRVWLDRGRYRVQTRVKTDDIRADLGDPRGGAGIRLGRSRPEKYTLGSHDWHEINYDFSIDEPMTEVQIVCEFRGTQGQAVFDLDAIRLHRVKTDPKP